MLIDILLLLVGFALLIKGADLFVDGSCNVARLLKIPPIIIGLTIVALGTSAPEAAVSISAALRGANEIALSNVIGSNLFNLLMVIGICAMIKPIHVSKDLLKRDLPFNILCSILLLVLVLDRDLQRYNGIIMLVLFVAFMSLLIRSALKSRKLQKEEESEVNEIKTLSPLVSVIFILIGIVGVIFGGDLVVDHACNIAAACGLSQTLIGLTIIACGTSLPELVTSVVASRKGENDLALGNVVGSNIFNLLFILGISSTIHPIAVAGITVIDVILLAIITAAIFPILISKKRVSRLEGGFFVFVYVSYIIYAIIR